MAHYFSLSTQQRSAFARDGALRLEGLVPRQDAEPLVRAIWSDLERRYGMRRGHPETLSVEHPAHFQELMRSGIFGAFADIAVSVASAFTGESGWTQAGQLRLVTFPGASWDVPRRAWHFDAAPSDCAHELPMFRLFVFLDDVLPRGGGTCYVEGSHRLALHIAEQAPDRLRSRDVTTALARESSWFRDLFGSGEDRVRRFMTEGHALRGVVVRVCEMTGPAGDAFVMHPALCHTASPNIRDRPRTMLTLTLTRQSA
jgi:ectoine hydroxylase-related dioxygenase (phytanoyl-CoA dioxygenase family)